MKFNEPKQPKHRSLSRPLARLTTALIEYPCVRPSLVIKAVAAGASPVVEHPRGAVLGGRRRRRRPRGDLDPDLPVVTAAAAGEVESVPEMLRYQSS